MPAYEYKCNACGSHFEKRQKMSDPAIESCPACGGTVKRLISGGAGIISKGNGNQSSNVSEVGSGCGSDMPCCGQGGGCIKQQFCGQ
jgi:putative FmdB family regulatory protein